MRLDRPMSKRRLPFRGKAWAFSVVAWAVPVSLSGGARAEGPPAASTSVPPKPGDVPAEIAVPKTARMVLRLHAKGVQVYKCGPLAADGTKITWTFTRPEATLTDSTGAAAGVHGAGPSWIAKDGSSVVGQKAAQSASPRADAVPWLLLDVIGHGGAGVLSKVAFIQRVNTVGGKEPTAGCGETTMGTEKRVPYQADYLFFE